MKQTALLILGVFLTLSGFSQKKPPKASLDTLPVTDLPAIDQTAFGGRRVPVFVYHYMTDRCRRGRTEYLQEHKENTEGREALHVVGTGKTSELSTGSLEV